MTLKIFPPIGITRVGDSPDWFIGPERPWHPGVDPDEQDSETTVRVYKDHDLSIKRQGARFRLFESDADGGWKPYELPNNARIEWSVHLVNKKGAIERPFRPPSSATRPVLEPGSEDRVINPDSRTISGTRSSGVYFDTGHFQGRPVPLGELKTDFNQNLIVLGGNGFSSSPRNTSLRFFYTNPGWHDDVSDGPVTAKVILADGSELEADGAWVVVGPPDFAPDVGCVVTLYDTLRQVGFTHFNVAIPDRPSFTDDIYPMLQRTSMLHWVNVEESWSAVSTNWAALADNSDAARQLRQENERFVRDVERVLQQFSLTLYQDRALSAWAEGRFESDWDGPPRPNSDVTADGLTKAALGNTIGQGFHPGIEAGIILKDPTLYSTPFEFRLDHNALEAGDLSALMAQPWQADFLACSADWWPAQRPNFVFPENDPQHREDWSRGVDNYLEMVQKFSKLGVVVAQEDGQGNVVYVEKGRAPDVEFF